MVARRQRRQASRAVTIFDLASGRRCGLKVRQRMPRGRDECSRNKCQSGCRSPPADGASLTNNSARYAFQGRNKSMSVKIASAFAPGVLWYPSSSEIKQRKMVRRLCLPLTLRLEVAGFAARSQCR